MFVLVEGIGRLFTGRAPGGGGVDDELLAIVDEEWSTESPYSSR